MDSYNSTDYLLPLLKKVLDDKFGAGNYEIDDDVYY